MFKLCLISPKETLLCVVDKWLRKAGIHDMREQTPFTTHQKVRHSMILTSRYRRTKHRGLCFRRFECTNAEGGRIARVSLLAAFVIYKANLSGSPSFSFSSSFFFLFFIEALISDKFLKYIHFNKSRDSHTEPQALTDPQSLQSIQY